MSSPPQPQAEQASPVQQFGTELKETADARSQAEIYKSLGNDYHTQGAYKEAINQYTRAIESFPEASFYGNRAASRIMLGEWQAALADAQKSVELDQSFTKGYLRAGKCYIKLGDFMRAKINFEKATELEPRNSDAKKQLQLVNNMQEQIDNGKALLNQGQFMEAIRTFAEILAEAEASLPVMVLKARALQGLGQHVQASKIASLVLRQEPHNVEALFVRGKSLFHSGALDHAATHFSQALRLDPDYSLAREELKIVKAVERAKKEGNEAFASGNYLNAIECYTAALSADVNEESPPIRSQLYCNRAAAFERLGKLEESVQDCNRALGLDSNYVKAYSRRARAYMCMERFEEAVRDYEQAKIIDPENPDIRSNLREAQLELKKSKRKDYYKILGIPKNADDNHIKKAYRKLALKWHPDKHGHSPEAAQKAEEMFKEVGEAFSVLSDPRKKQRYDMGVDDEEGGFGDAHVDPSTLFNMFFASMMNLQPKLYDIVLSSN